MRGPVNGYAVDSTALPQWVVRAVVVATAAATFAVDGVRTVQASVLADAKASVTLSDLRTVAGRASGVGQARAFLFPTFRFASSVDATASASGYAVIKRDVFGEAGGDASADGLAFVGLVGDASASGEATVDECSGHLIRPAASYTPCNAQCLTLGGDVTRYPLARVSASATGSADAMLKKDGESFYRMDGYAASAGSASGELPQDRSAVIVTLGTFTFAEGVGTCRAHLVQPATVARSGEAVSFPVNTTRGYAAKSTNTLGALGSAEGTRVVVPFATSFSGSASYGPVANIGYAARAANNAAATVQQPLGVLKIVATSGNTASASLSATSFGTQHPATTDRTASATGSLQALQKFVGLTSASASAVTIAAVYGTQAKATITATAGASAPAVTSLIRRWATVSQNAGAIGSAVPANNPKGSASATATASGFAQYAAQYRGQAASDANSVGTAIAKAKHAAVASKDAAATGRAEGFSNADVPAPSDRRMLVPADRRAMVVPFDNRAMVIVYDDRQMRIAA